MNQPDIPPASVPHTLARVRSLQRHRGSRDSSRTFWIEGVRPFVQAAEAGFSFDAIVHSKVLLTSGLARKLIGRLSAAGVRRVGVTPEQFRGVSITERASGVGAIVRQRWTPIDHADATRGLCWLVLEHVRSPGNLGTVLRTAEATGVGGVILLGPACDPYDPPVVRASMGGIFHLPLVRTSHAHLRRWADGNGMKLLALTPGGADLWPAGGGAAEVAPAAHAAASLPPSSPSSPASPASSFAPPRVALLIGEERKGLSPRAIAMSDEKIRLPMTGRADSLNIGVATGVMLYELVRRQRGHGGAVTAAPR